MAFNDAIAESTTTIITGAVDILTAVRLATAAALPACTAAGSGVGKTLTGNANGALSVDGTLTVAADRILVKDQATAADNGIYVVTTVGTAGTPFVLTRATDADATAELTAGATVNVTAGTATPAGNSGTAWYLATAAVTVDTTAQTWLRVPSGADIGALAADVDAILVDTDSTIPGILGTPAGASLAADVAAVKAETALIVEDTGTTLPATLGTPAGVSLAADLAAIKAETAALLVDTGDAADAAVAAGVAGSLHAHIRSAQVDTTAILEDTGTTLPAILGTPAGASISADLLTIDNLVDDLETRVGTPVELTSLVGMIGKGDDAAGSVGTAAESLHSKLRKNLVDTAALLVDTGDGTDAIVLAGSAGSLHAHLRGVQAAVGTAGDATTTNTVQGLLGDPTDAAVDAAGAGEKTVFAALRSLGGKIDAVDDYVDAEIAAIKAVTDVAPRTLVVAITGEPNAGALTVATVGSQRVAITRLQIKTLAAVAAELTSLPVTGGPSGVVSFLSAAQAADTYFDAAGKGVSWSGYEVLEVSETIVVTRNGSGVGTDLNAIIAIEYVPLVAGGVLT